MKALISNNAAPSIEHRPEPTPSELQVRVRTHAMALNNADLAATGDLIAGFEFSGVVDAVGTDAPQELVGQRVMGIGEGAFADFVVADHRHVLVIPDSVSFSHAAALPTALSTEYGALRRAGLNQGSTVLITAATSGIALIGMQVAHTLGAGVVIGTTRNADRADLLHRAGADHTVVLDNEVSLADQVYQLTNGHGADVVLDHVSGAGLGQAIDAARTGGAVVSVGRITGATAEIDLFSLARQKVTLQSVSYGLTPPEVIGDLFAGVVTDLMDAVATGQIRSIVDSEFAFEDAPNAFQRLGSGEAQGKVVLTRA